MHYSRAFTYLPPSRSVYHLRLAYAVLARSCGSTLSLSYKFTNEGGDSDFQLVVTDLQESSGGKRENFNRASTSKDAASFPEKGVVPLPGDKFRGFPHGMYSNLILDDGKFSIKPASFFIARNGSVEVQAQFSSDTPGVYSKLLTLRADGGEEWSFSLRAEVHAATLCIKSIDSVLWPLATFTEALLDAFPLTPSILNNLYTSTNKCGNPELKEGTDSEGRASAYLKIFSEASSLLPTTLEFEEPQVRHVRLQASVQRQKCRTCLIQSPSEQPTSRQIENACALVSSLRFSDL